MGRIEPPPYFPGDTIAGRFVKELSATYLVPEAWIGLEEKKGGVVMEPRHVAFRQAHPAPSGDGPGEK
jgi:hypothetical protein